MKKSNWVLFGALVLISVLLLWLWYFLGFNNIDNPFDLVLSILWWVMVVVAIVTIWQVEKRRQERIRTIYVGDRFTFNSERGKKGYVGQESLMKSLADTLDTLEYDFTRYDLPDTERLPIQLLVRTKKYSADSVDASKNEWEGEVCVVGDDKEKPFKTQQELSAIINNYQAFKAH